MELITKSMVIHDTADNIFAALTQKEDLTKWWGSVNPNADGTTIWFGRDREWDVPIVALEPGKLLSFSFDSHHPYDHSRVEPTEISITISDLGNKSVVTVVQSMYSDDAWNELIHDGWVFSLLSLQLWVEQGRTFADWLDTSKFHTVRKAVALTQDANWAWDALTNGAAMSTWFEANASSDPVLGGDVRIEWSAESVVSGEWVLTSKPRNLVCHWWDTASTEKGGDPERVTVQQWLILPAVEGCVVTLTEYGYELETTSATYIQQIEEGWDQFLNNLQKLATDTSQGNVA